MCWFSAVDGAAKAKVLKQKWIGQGDLMIFSLSQNGPGSLPIHRKGSPYTIVVCILLFRRCLFMDVILNPSRYKIIMSEGEKFATKGELFDIIDAKIICTIFQSTQLQCVRLINVIIKAPYFFSKYWPFKIARYIIKLIFAVIEVFIRILISIIAISMQKNTSCIVWRLTKPFGKKSLKLNERALSLNKWLAWGR